MQGHSIENGPHRVFANTEMHIATSQVLRFEVAGPINVCMGTWSEVCGAAHHFRQTSAEDLDHFARSDAGGHRSIRRSKSRQSDVPIVRQVPVNHSVELSSKGRVLLREGLESRLPLHLRIATPGDSSSKMLQRLLGDKESR